MKVKEEKVRESQKTGDADASPGRKAAEEVSCQLDQTLAWTNLTLQLTVLKKWSFEGQFGTLKGQMQQMHIYFFIILIN